jgi:hypothetical protein
MQLRSMIRLIALIAAAIAALAATSSAVATGGGSEVSAHAGKGKIPQTDCFWTGIVASKFSDDPAENYAFPDTGAVYWTAKVTMPEGSRIILNGKYAHARYQSINSYDTATNAPTDALNDVSTVPDMGSKNPYLPRAKRNTKDKKRKFTIKILKEQVPASRPKNTLYAGVPGQDTQRLVLRVYEPDSFKQNELTGGVGLPQAALRLEDGTILKGQDACDTLQAESGPLEITALPAAVYGSLRDQPGKPEQFPAVEPPLWQTYYNTGFIVSCWYNGSCDTSPQKTGGQYSNVDNEYAAAFVNRGFADGPVLVLKGKLPTTPTTGSGVKKMGKGQLRYWSMCQNESLFTTVGAGCLYDSQVPTNKNGRYTIVTSKAVDRPSNARRKCGVGYIPWPEAGDGAGHLDDGFLVIRNMLPAGNFHRAVQDTSVPGDEKSVMGPYLPDGSYTTKSAFQKKGC